MLSPHFPIIDLHCHFEGAISPHKSYEILHRIGYGPAQNQDEFFQRVIGFPSGREGFFQAISLLDMCLIDRTSVIEVTADIITRAVEQNVKILEISCAPRKFKLQEPRKGGLQEFMDALLAGIETGSRRQDIAVGVTLLVLPQHLTEDFTKMYGDIGDIIKAYRQHLTGVDICTLDPLHGEQYSRTHLQHICNSVHASGLHLSAHAGEFFDAQPVARAIQLGVERIGHGIRIIHDQHVLEQIKAHNITLEVCPISNYRTGALKKDEEHPLRHLLKAGVSVTINSDDQGVQNSTWRDDYIFAQERIGLSDEDITLCLRNAFAASFLSPEQKEPYRKLFMESI